MAVRATVLPLPEPGCAILRVTDIDAPPEGLALSIQRQQGPDSHLADNGWRRTEAWLIPGFVERTRGAIDFHLGPETCDQLAGIATVRLRIKEPEIGVIATTVVAWPQMLTSGAIDGASRNLDETLRLRRAQQAATPPPPAPPFEFPPEPVPEPAPAPIPELRAERVVLPPPRRSGAGWLIAFLLLIAIGGAGYYAYTTNFHGAKDVADQQIAAYFPHEKPAEPQPEPPAAAPTVAATQTPTPVQAPPPKRSIRDTVGDYLATKPAPEAMLAKGKEYAQAGELNGAFLVWRRAAESGSVEAQLQVAGFYDPVQPQPKAGFTPDGARAAEWYERAALAGNAEAQRKYGLLLAKGGAGLAADPAQAKVWLQQAAQQNDVDAKKALDALPK
jgi:hypothetical protein